MGNFQEEEEKMKKQDTGNFLYFVLGDCGEQIIYKLDLNRQFTATELPPQVADFSLKGCSSRKRRPLSSPSVNGPFTLGRCNRYLTIKKTKSLLPLLPKPFLKLWRSRSDLQEEAAMVALGSKIYMIGGNLYDDVNSKLIGSRDMFVIDSHDHSTVKKAAPMNSVKVWPLAWAIGGKIYVMPHALTADPPLFECFDPDSNSWTILPSPPCPTSDDDHDLPKSDGVEILSDRYLHNREPLSVSSHAVLGSTLIISLETRKGVYAFDTAQPHRGWRRIFLSLTPSLALNFIPFRPESFPIRDLCIFSRHRHDQWYTFLDDYLQNRFKIGDGDTFVCSFGDLGSEFVKVSIAPVSGVSRSRHEEFVEFLMEAKVAPIGDGLVLLAKAGSKKGKGRRGEEGVGVIHYSFDIFRVVEEEDDYVASNISSALFRTKSECEAIDIPFAFVCKDGAFTN